jgi:hypothetical protein
LLNILLHNMFDVCEPSIFVAEWNISMNYAAAGFATSNRNPILRVCVWRVCVGVCCLLKKHKWNIHD